MGTDLAWKINGKDKVKLKDYDPGYMDEHEDRTEADQKLAELSDELSELQELLAAAKHHSLLIILQGMDTSGKDGTIRHVFSHINPQGCNVYSFKVPTEEEREHDFLWRIHKVTPRKGGLTIFNRSHYEDVLVVRVHNEITQKTCRHRYEAINDFEHQLSRDGTIVLKFFLHISKEEQERRLLARVHEKGKAWKISASDFSERKYWSDYQEAYEDALNECSTKSAPWYIIPADHKWYRNLAIAHTLVHTMREYRDTWKADLEERGAQELAELKKMGIV
jgi:PPK2 family polyphosphate:nucleotide phosphotransferase